MNIEYLRLMKNTPRLYISNNRGVKEQDIISLEEKIGKVFPKAYKEFLFLGGNNANMMGNIDHGFYDYEKKSNTYMLQIQEWVHETLENANLEIEGGEFWAICHLDGGEQFHFFYFNDPDAADPENPPVYASYPAYVDEGESLKRKIADSFSQYIEDQIRAYQ